MVFQKKSALGRDTKRTMGRDLREASSGHVVFLQGGEVKGAIQRDLKINFRRVEKLRELAKLL